ncbi:D-glycero-alpha-D-manno-heptose-1,7-bisphosphate 7-phosphatase [Virgibacillus proomii]|jgi:D-glycero-D-manno-heptose 1,7-bisphosphate phosphatase|uniref:D-glycero-alpha-D-manno-heptose-1,7-bisphosphate 7-phosphatase n=1 Tax=Virgibacillus proomii TaxID=84407 RepID=UPI00098643A5|nr:HAD family hydrolase [Virgibacillus proomii]
MGKRAVYLDRDGVINEVLTKRVTFVNHPDDFYLLHGVGPSIKRFNELGYYVFVVTNQGGIGLGYMTEAELTRVHEKMIAELAAYGAEIHAIAYCPHKPDAGCSCRKPSAKMINDLARQYNVDLATSYMIGDRDVDITAGKNAGLTTILIGKREKTSKKADLKFSDLTDVADYLTDQAHR